MVGDHPREGPEPPARARRAVRTARARQQRRDQVQFRATSSGPTRCSSRARTGTPPTTTGRTWTGEVNNLPSTVGGGGFHADGKLPRFREVDFRARVRARARSTAPTSSTGRSTTTSSSRTTPPPSGSSASPATTRAQPVRRVAVGSVPDAAGPRHVLRACSPPRPRPALGYHPYRAPTGVNSVEYDGRPACNNCGFCGFFGCPIDAKGDPVAPLRHALRTGRCEIRPGAVRHRGRARRQRTARRAACATSTPTATEHEVTADARGRRAAARSRRRGCCCGPASATPTSSAASSCTTSRRSCSASSRSGCTRTAAAPSRT